MRFALEDYASLYAPERGVVNRVKGEVGLQDDLKSRVLDNVVMREWGRQWKVVMQASDLALMDVARDEELLWLEIKSGYNEAEPEDEHEEEEQQQQGEGYERKVLSRSFFLHLTTYLREVGRIQYSPARWCLEDFPAKVIRDGTEVLYPFRDRSDQENINRVLSQVSSPPLRAISSGST